MKEIGAYRHYENCRFCDSADIIKVIDLGLVPLAGGFLQKNASKGKLLEEKFYPLDVYFCSKCYLAQTSNVIDKDTLFSNYFYFSSSIKTLVNHFQKTAEELKNMFPNTKKKFIVEIGCNDGTFVRSLQKNGFTALGVDPAKNVVEPLIKELPIINDYFSQKLAGKIARKYGNADSIWSFNTLAHIENMHDIVLGIKTLLKADGFLAFEVHYLGNLITEMQYDMIYHEHQYYYSLLTLQKLFSQYDMEIFDARLIPIHAGSIRFYIQNKQSGNRPMSINIKKLLIKEKSQKLDTVIPYIAFFNKIEKQKRDLLKLLKKIKKDGKTIVGYGASGRGTILMNYCGINGSFLDYILDDSPARQHVLTPGTHVETISSDILHSKKRPDYTLLFAWSFVDEIKKKNLDYLNNGGRFIIPLPNIQIVDK